MWSCILSSLRMHTITWIRRAFFKARQIGTDQYGNVYFEQPMKKRYSKRWVMFKGIAEGSRVPPEWHGWLHHMMDKPPFETYDAPYDWQQPHKPNLTGTPFAYRPTPINNNVGRPYDPWQPAK